MRELPILFSAPMVRAILDGRKTVTRRVVKLPRDLAAIGGDLEQAHADLLWGVTPGLKVPCADDTVQRLRNPWMWPSEEGVRLWVRETWGIRDIRGFWCRDSIKGLAAEDVLAESGIEYGASLTTDDPSAFWRPSIHMPRWASRITLAVTDVRAERLHEITEEDARAEGVEPACDCGMCRRGLEPCMGMEPVYRDRFRGLWDTINGDRAAWASSPWVWRVAFEVVR